MLENRSTLAARQSNRVRQAIREERKGGLRLALRLRVAVLAIVAVYLVLGYGLEWRQLINAGALTALCLVSLAQYLIAASRWDTPLAMAVFPIADILIVVVTLFGVNEWAGALPRIFFDENREFSWFALLLTMQALAYRPWLAAWAGFVTAAAWIGILLWMLRYPGAHGSLRFDTIPPGADHVHIMLQAFYDPLYVNADVWIREAIIAVLCGTMLAVAVQRSQGMMARALQAERSRANLARYFAPTVVDQLSGKDEPFDKPREQDVGVLFVDMVGFTRLAECLSPGDLIELLREFHGMIARQVFDHGGTLDKFIGDCAMATFGTPLATGSDATNTISCACAIRAAVANWNAERCKAGLFTIKVGIGAHYGPVVLGDIGDERRMEFAVLGDTVNVASRLEALTRKLSCTILLSGELVSAGKSERLDSLTPLLASFAPAQPQKLRNREAPVALWYAG